jgi:hypothetical protein
VKGLLGGYGSLIREMLGLRNDTSFLSLTARIPLLIAICGLIGLVRNALSTWLHVLPGCYSFHADILWAMFNFPVHLFLFPSALLHWQLQRLGYRHVRAETVFGLSFYLQILHLVIPFLDWLGYRLGMPWSYVIGTHVVRTRWYTNDIYMTPGIIIGWWITAFVVARVLTRRLEIRWWAVILTSLTTFLAILIPTYALFTALNTLFNRTFGLLLWNPQDYPYNSPSWFLHWGNGTYLALTAMLGLVYFLRHRSKGNA